MVTASANANSSQYLSLNLALPFTLTKWWNIQNNITGTWQQFNGSYEEPVRTENTSLFLNASQNFMLPKDFTISISGYYSSGFMWGNYIFKSSGSIDAAIQKKFSKQRSSLTLNVTNIIPSFSINRLSAEFPAQNLTMRNENIYSHTGISLSFTHNFGSDKVLQKRDRTTGAEDEKGRAY